MSYNLHDVIVWTDDKAKDNIELGVITEVKKRGGDLTVLNLVNQKGTVYIVENAKTKTILKSKEVLANITTDIKITGAIHMVACYLTVEER
jgi:hypothetical protein